LAIAQQTLSRPHLFDTTINGQVSGD